MKVLFLPDYSAANAYQRALAEALADQGVTVSADATRARRVVPVLKAVRRHGRPDIIHVHWTEPYIAAGGRVSRLKAYRTLAELRLLRRAGVGLVWTAHDLFRHDQSVDPAERSFLRSLAGTAGAVITHCGSARDAIGEALDLPRSVRAAVRVIPHGHYVGAYSDTISRHDARARLGLPDEARVVAFVGWVRPYKGVAELIEAFNALPDASARLVIAGRALDATYADRVSTLAGRDARVHLSLGFVPDDDLQVYLRAADVVATPFLEVFTSGSVLLAMSFGRAVIAPRAGCVSESLDDDGGILYEPDDPAGLGDALRRAMEADVEAMGRHNAARLGEFDWARVAAATLATYEEVLASRRKR